jgi:hypothetical protein
METDKAGRTPTGIDEAALARKRRDDAIRTQPSLAKAV